MSHLISSPKFYYKTNKQGMRLFNHHKYLNWVNNTSLVKWLIFIKFYSPVVKINKYFSEFKAQKTFKVVCWTNPNSKQRD